MSKERMRKMDDRQSRMAGVRELGDGAPRVRDCLELGWQVSLLRSEYQDPCGEENLTRSHPGELTSAEHLGVGLERVERLIDAIASSQSMRDTVSRLEDVRRALAYSAEASGARRAFAELDAELLTALCGAGDECATAYRLGRAVADTCTPSPSLAQLRQRLAADRMTELRTSVDELQAVLPDHAAAAVGLSLETWRAWTAQHLGPAASETDAEATARSLAVQGRRWHAVLVGEHRAAEVLEPEDYEELAGSTLGRLRSVAARAARTFWLPLLATTALFGLGVALVVAWSGGAQVIAGLGVMVLATAVGWRMLAGMLRPLTARLEAPIWEAELTRAIAHRLTVLPEVASPAPDAARPIRMARRHVLREEAPAPSRSHAAPQGTDGGDRPPLVFGPPVPPPEEVAGGETGAEGDTVRLYVATRPRRA